MEDLENLTDVALVGLAQAGNRHAFGQLIERYSQMVRHLAPRFAGRIGAIVTEIYYVADRGISLYCSHKQQAASGTPDAACCLWEQYKLIDTQ